MGKARVERVIASLDDLREYLGSDTVAGMNRRIYKDTECGASISVRTPDFEWHHNGQDWSGVKAITAFTIQTIVEGSDTSVDSDEFSLPVTVREVDRWIKDMEKEAHRLWKEANPVQTKYDLVREIETLIKHPTVGLWRADRTTLETLLQVLQERRT